MRFRSSQSRSPYLNRKDQLRLLGLFVTLIVVLIAANVAGDPATWAWMFPREPVPSDSADAPASAKLQGRASAVEPDDQQRTSPEPATGDLRISADWLASVRDDYSGIRRSEADAYYRVLSQLISTPADRLDEAAHDDVGYTLLMADPDRYRGLPITIEGEIRRLLPLPPERDAGEVGQLYEAWLFTRESGTNPYRVVATGLTGRLPQGEAVKQPVRVTGYFFKRQAYDAQGGLKIAPLLLAKTIHALQPVADQPIQRGIGLTPYVAGFAALVALALAITLWRYQQSDRSFQRRHKRRLTEAPPGAIEDLAGIETVDPAEMLKQMAEDAKRQ